MVLLGLCIIVQSGKLLSHSYFLIVFGVSGDRKVQEVVNDVTLTFMLLEEFTVKVRVVQVANVAKWLQTLDVDHTI